MSYKDLFGYFLTMLGIALSLLFGIFLVTSDALSYNFYLALGSLSAISVITGIWIKDKAH
jgi:hypothetical protein